MRVYLDTNILAFIVGQDRGSSISDDVKGIIKDYESLLLSSCVCYGELMHLIQIGKVHVPGCKDIRRATDEALRRLDEIGVSMVPVTMNHIRTLIDLPLWHRLSPTAFPSSAPTASSPATSVTVSTSFRTGDKVRRVPCRGLRVRMAPDRTTKT